MKVSLYEVTARASRLSFSFNLSIVSSKISQLASNKLGFRWKREREGMLFQLFFFGLKNTALRIRKQNEIWLSGFPCQSFSHSLRFWVVEGGLLGNRGKRSLAFSWKYGKENVGTEERDLWSSAYHNGNNDGNSDNEEQIFVIVSRPAVCVFKQSSCSHPWSHDQKRTTWWRKEENKVKFPVLVFGWLTPSKQNIERDSWWVGERCQKN